MNRRFFSRTKNGIQSLSVKESATVKQDFATLTVTDEIGQRNVNHMGNALEWVAENMGVLSVGVALVAGLVATALTAPVTVTFSTAAIFVGIIAIFNGNKKG